MIDDASYLEAVRRGDMRTAQRMVDEAAKEAGYNVGPVWHGSQEPWTKFDLSKVERAGFGYGAHFSESEKQAFEQYSGPSWDRGVARKFFLKLQNPVPFSRYRNELKKIGFTFYKPDQLEREKGITEKFIQEGFDGMVYFDDTKEPTNFVVFSPSQIKSADTITRDDAGNVIPLSRRFQPDSPDIRNPKTRKGHPPQFPYDYAAYLKRNFPSIWRRGGNIRGNDTFRWWTAWRRGDRSPTVMHWWHVTRPAWIARHYRNRRLPGVIAQIKWGTVGVLGVAGMKRVVEDAIRKGL